MPTSASTGTKDVSTAGHKPERKKTEEKAAATKAPAEKKAAAKKDADPDAPKPLPLSDPSGDGHVPPEAHEPQPLADPSGDGFVSTVQPDGSIVNE